jgi:hypothetical protein
MLKAKRDSSNSLRSHSPPGAFDDYIVPLRVGSTYTLTLNLDQFWCHETKEFVIPLLLGKNRMTARISGQRSETG